MKILKKLFPKSFFSGVRGNALQMCFKQPTPRRLFGRSKIFPCGRFSLLHFIEILFSCGYLQVILRPHRVFADILIILYLQIGTHPPPPVSLRLGHAAGLTVPRTVIQYRGAASLLVNRGGKLESARLGVQRFEYRLYGVKIRSIEAKSEDFALNRDAVSSSARLWRFSEGKWRHEPTRQSRSLPKASITF